MHKFLRAVGFSDLRKKEIDKLINEIIERPEILKVTSDSEGNEFAEMTCEYGKYFGIIVRGIYDENDEFVPEYYVPYLLAKTVGTEEYIEIEKYADRESYAGVCDDMRVGVTLIFYLQNVADYLAERKLFGTKNTRKGAYFSALSVEGKVLFPLVKRDTVPEATEKRKSEHNNLIAKAREGDEEAIESLTLEDMDTYSQISQRIHNEDILSIVSTYFMPYGIESDQYSVLGEIYSVSKEENRLTGESIYVMEICCNEITFDVAINEKDLIGEPQIGRRFKGNIWLQGATVS